MTPDPPAPLPTSCSPARPTSPRTRPPLPGHADWEVLCALLPAGRVLDLYESDGRLTRAVLPAAADRSVATPVARAVALSLVSRGWLARAGRRAVAGAEVTSYRLSLRGWYAVRRLRPDLTFGRPGRGRAGGSAADIAAGPDRG